MSALRRMAQTNNVSANSSAAASPSTPIRASAHRPGPSTPKTRISYTQSPVMSPSLSASTPFDWEAARTRRPPPYATPTKRLTKLRNGEAILSTPQKSKIVRKKGFVEKITSLPSEITFYWEVSSSHIELVSPEKLAWVAGGLLHFLHFCARVAQIHRIPDSDLGWEDMYREDEGEDWFNWTVPLTGLLMVAAFVNTFYLFTRTRLYQLYLAQDPMPSPNAKFVSRERTPEEEESAQVGIVKQVLQHVWHAFAVSVRFLLNLAPPKSQEVRAAERIQIIEKWDPREFETILFCVYSPVHSLLWLALTSANWILITMIMAGVSIQTRALMKSFSLLLKDERLIQKEVMHEYDEKFVNPRIHPVRRDAAVMTHQAEMLDR